MTKRRSIEIDLGILGPLQGEYSELQARGEKKEFLLNLLTTGVIVRTLQAQGLLPQDDDLSLATRLEARGKSEMAREVLVARQVNEQSVNSVNAANPVREQPTFRAETPQPIAETHIRQPPEKSASSPPADLKQQQPGKFKLGEIR